jgi:hypothetical protein
MCQAQGAGRRFYRGHQAHLQMRLFRCVSSGWAAQKDSSETFKPSLTTSSLLGPKGNVTHFSTEQPMTCARDFAGQESRQDPVPHQVEESSAKAWRPRRIKAGGWRLRLSGGVFVIFLAVGVGYWMDLSCWVGQLHLTFSWGLDFFTAWQLQSHWNS